MTSVSSGEQLHRRSFVLDLHTHGPGFVPQPFRVVWRAATVGAPPEVGFDALRKGGVDAAVAKAVGDPIVTRWYLGRSPWDAVEAQLARIEQQADDAGALVVRSVDGLAQARAQGRPAVLLGVEGADAVGSDVDRVDAWHERGVRVVVLVHLRDNLIGTTCLPWQRYVGPLPVRRRASPGLSPFGLRVVERMMRLGILVDVAHADRATLLAVVGAATAPVVSSHTGARAVQDFPRYLADDELRAIASTGGVIGLWPYRARRTGVRDIPELVAHARHIADTVGPEHLALGTDMNGVPGVMAGFGGETDLPKLTAALLDGGFGEREVEEILGGNALRVLKEAAERASKR
ncbi:MAG TPA: membrane dipeptidase [Jatrophihabitans sp.]|jgi:membrane dipeptidase|nr:membrane dipeptidase [Jatrophihabitans sp.]